MIGQTTNQANNPPKDGTILPPTIDVDIQSPNQKIPDRKTKCVIETHLNIKQNVIFGANLKPV